MIATAVKAENDRYVNAPEGATFGFPPEMFQKALEYEAAFVRAGGTLAAGVDPTGYGAALPGFGDQRNFELLRDICRDACWVRCVDDRAHFGAENTVSDCAFEQCVELRHRVH